MTNSDEGGYQIEWTPPDGILSAVPLKSAPVKGWLSSSPPVIFTDTRRSYAEWVSKRGAQSGIYVWLLASPGEAELLRFLHVGLAQKGDSTMAKRTHSHCRGQFNGQDYIYSFKQEENGVGKLMAEWEKPQGVPKPTDLDAKAEKVLRSVRILFIYGRDLASPEFAIPLLEGAIAEAAEKLYGVGEVTNTNKATRRKGRALIKSSDDAEKLFVSLKEAIPSLRWPQELIGSP